MGLDPLGGTTAPSGCRVVDELSLLFGISYTLESSLELRDVIRPVLLKMAEVLGLKRGTITILRGDHGEVTISEAVGLPAGREGEYLQACRELIRQVTSSGQALVVEDISKEPVLGQRWTEETPAEQADKTLAYICVPIRCGTEVVGALSVERVLNGPVPRLASDRRLLSLIANVIAQTVHIHRATQEKLSALQRENERLQEQMETHFRPKNILGNSKAMRSVFLHIEQVASSTTTVLIRGESGVGKELVARALHEQGPRQGKAFVKFNCAALPESIIESELFGHERGAFTGAVAMRKGRFEIADVALDGRLAADALEFLFLQHAQQLDLGGGRDVADFIKKDRSAIGNLEPPFAHGHRAGKRALFVAK